MHAQTVLPRESLAAHFTRKRSLLRVGRHVALEAGAVAERLVAVLAGEWARVRVRTLVLPQVGAVVEGLATKSTHIRPLSGVDSLVHAQVGAVGKGLGTEVAHERSLARVHTQVGLEAASLAEGLAAEAARKHTFRVDHQQVRLKEAGGFHRGWRNGAQYRTLQVHLGSGEIFRCFRGFWWVRMHDTLAHICLRKEKPSLRKCTCTVRASLKFEGTAANA